MNTDSQKFFAETPPVKLFFKAALPGIVSMFAMSIYSIIEGIFLGQMAGGDAFAAMSLAMPFVMINFTLSDMVGVGSSVIISIALGEKEEKRASNIFSCAVLLTVSMAVLMGVFIYVFAPGLIRIMGAEGEVAAMAVKYLRICAAFSPVTTITFSMDNYLRICGFVRGSMLLNILMTVLQVGFLLLLLVILDMGLIGSVLAFNFSITICSIIALIPFLLRKTTLKFVRPKFDLPTLKKIVACGLPTFFNNTAGRIFSIIMNAMLIRMGGTIAVSAFTVMMYASDLVQPVLYGLCDSLQPAIGYNWGAKSYDRVKALAKCVFTAAAVASVVAIILMFGLPRQIVSLFVESSNAELLELSVHGLLLFSTKFFFWWFSFVCQGFFNAIEKPLYSTILTLSTAIVFPLLMVLLLWPLGLDGLWLNQTATYIPVGILSFIMLKKVQRSMKEQQLAAK